MATAKLFWTGRSQAVRLPKEFRFDGDTVSIRKDGNRVVLEPISQDWAWLDKIVGQFDEDFYAAIEEPVAEQERPELDEFFK
jgi:antitoxin VapB